MEYFSILNISFSKYKTEVPVRINQLKNAPKLHVL